MPRVSTENMQKTHLTTIMVQPVVLFIGLLMLFSSGCAVDNEFLAKMPLFEAKSDRIPGLMPATERRELIRAKGEKGAKTSDQEKEVIVAQLMVEYRTSPDPNMRREAVDAMAKIPHAKRDEYMKEILKDDDPFVRLSALEAMGESFNGSQNELLAIMIEHLKTDRDKDVRLAAVRLLGPIAKSTSKEGNELTQTIILALGEALYDKVPAIRYEAMHSLAKTTKQDYGKDINRWIQYVQYVKGETTEQPKERTLAERLPTIHLPMFK